MPQKTVKKKEPVYSVDIISTSECPKGEKPENKSNLLILKWFDSRNYGTTRKARRAAFEFAESLYHSGMARIFVTTQSYNGTIKSREVTR